MFQETLRKAFASVSAAAVLLTTIIVPGMGVNLAHAAIDPADQPFFDFVIEDLGISSSDLPEGEMTRDDVCDVLWKADGSPTDAPASGLSDVVGDSKWDHCVDMGYFSGTADGRADKNRTITREEVAKPIANFLGEEPLSQSETDSIGSSFSDWNQVDSDPSGSNGLDRYVALMVDLGVYKGFGDGTMRPKNKIIGPHFASAYTKTLIDPSDNSQLTDAGATAAQFVAVANGEDVDTVLGAPAPVGAAGTLTVSQNAYTGPTVLADGTLIEPMELVFSAGGSSASGEVASAVDPVAQAVAIQVTRVCIRVGGVGNDNQLDGAYLFNTDGSQIVKRRAAFTDGVACIETNLTVVAGAPVTQILAIAVEATFQSGTLNFTVYEVESTAVTVVGLPMTSVTIQIVDGAPSIGGVSIDVQIRNATQKTVDVGETTIFTEFEFQAGGNENVLIKSVTMRDQGSAQPGDIIDLKLIIKQTGEVVASCEVMGEFYFCLFIEAYNLREGENVNILVEGTINPNADSANRTVILVIDENYDVNACGVISEQRFLTTAGGTDTSYPIGDAGVNVTLILQGTITIAKGGGSPTGDINPGGDDIVVACFELEVFGESILIEEIAVDLTTGTLVAADITGTVRVFLATEGQAALDGQNLVSIDATDTGLFTVGGTLENANNIQVNVGTKYFVYVVLTLSPNATVGNTSTVGLTLQGDTLNSNVTFTTAQVFGNSLSVQFTDIDITVESTFTTDFIVAGTADVTIAKFVFQAGNDEAQFVSSLTFNISSITGAINMRVYREDLPDRPQFGTTRGSVALTNNTFSGDAVVGHVEQGATAIFCVVIDTQTTATGVYTVTLPANGVNFTGVESSTNRTGPAALINAAAQTFVATEVMLVATITQPTTGVAHAGQQGRDMLKVKIEARFGPVTLEDMRFLTFNGTANTTKYSLKLADGTVLVSNVSVVNGTLTFPLNMVLLENVETTFCLVADFSNSGNMISQQNVTVAYSGSESSGAGSGNDVFNIHDETTYFTASASTSSEMGFDANQHAPIFDNNAATPDVPFLATADFDFDSDFTASPTLNGAATTIAAGRFVSTMPWDMENTTGQQCIVSAAGGTAGCTLAAGDLIQWFDAGGASGLAVVNVADANLITGDTLNITLEGGTAAITPTVATGDVVIRYATAIDGIAAGGGFDVSNINLAGASAITTGNICFVADAGTDAFLTVATATVANNASAAAANVCNGVTLVDGDGLYLYTAVINETPAAASTAQFAAGGIYIVATQTSTQNGLQIAEASLPSGSNLLNTTLFPDLPALTANDRIAMFNASTGLTAENVQVQDAFPIVSLNNTGMGTLITAAEQLVAKLVITNPGPRQLSVSGIRLKCTGSWVDANVQDNEFRFERNGSVTIAHTRSDQGAQNCTNTVTITFTTPETVSPNGGTLEIWVYFDTSAGAGTNEFFQIQFDQTPGRVGASAVVYFYTQAAGGTGTNPTSVAPANIGNGSVLFSVQLES